MSYILTYRSYRSMIMIVRIFCIKNDGQVKHNIIVRSDLHKTDTTSCVSFHTYVCVY